MNKAPRIHPTKVIRFYGDLKKAETADGYTVYRVDRIFFREHGMVKCAPYDNHFIFDDPAAHIKGKRGRWTPMCSCGSIAVIAGYNAYRKDASPTSKTDSTIPGEMIVCYLHANTGKHADGSS